MIEVKSQQGALLAIISLTCLGCIYALCVCRKKKTILQQEDNILYNRGDAFDHNSRFFNVQRKTVIRQNKALPESPTDSRDSTMRLNRPMNTGDHHSSYQNIPNNGGVYEPTYVDPIPSLYANEDDADVDLDGGPYLNVFPTKDVPLDSDDYENTDFLKNRLSEDEPDYVNDFNEN